MPPARTASGDSSKIDADALRGPPRGRRLRASRRASSSRAGARKGPRICAPSHCVRAFLSSPGGRVGEAEVVLHLGVVGHAGLSGREKRHRVLGALQGHGEAARGLQQSQAVREPLQPDAIRLGRGQQVAVSLLRVAEHHEVAVGSLVGRRHHGRRLPAQVDLRLLRVVPGVFGVGQEDAATAVHHRHGVARARGQAGLHPDERLRGRQVERLLVHDARSVQDAQPTAAHRRVDVDAHGQVDGSGLAGLPFEVHDGFRVGARDPADRPHRHPVLGEADRLLRLQEAVGLLVAEEAGLHLDVGAHVVGERPAPVDAVGVAAERPDLLGGRVLGRRVVHDAGLRPGVIDAHEGLAAAVAEDRHGAVRVVADEREVAAGLVDGPGVDLGEAVRGRPAHRVVDAAVVVHAHRGVVPPVEAVADAASGCRGRRAARGPRGREPGAARPATAGRRRDPRWPPRPRRCRRGSSWSRSPRATSRPSCAKPGS